jgi:hypothetical protein
LALYLTDVALIIYKQNIYVEVKVKGFNVKQKENVLRGGASAVANVIDTAKDQSKEKQAPNALDKAKTEDKRSATEKAYDFGAKYANKIKDNADVFYGILYSIAITILMFLIFVPAVGFIVIGFICYSLLKNRISSLKSL